METPKNHPKVQAFLDDLNEVYRKHGMSLAHEDSNGAFLVEPYSEINVDWLNDASVSYERTVHEADAWISSLWMNKQVYRPVAPYRGIVTKTKWDEKGVLHCFVEGEERSCWVLAHTLSLEGACISGGDRTT